MKILNDFSTSVRKALEEIDPNYESYDGLVVCGTHSPHDVEEMIGEIRRARESGTPFLGICFGHQLAFIEWCRYKGIVDATSEEWGQGTFVIKKLPELKVGLHNGETYWNHYSIYGKNEEEIENLDWEKPSNFITCQYHPEYQSSKDKPHTLLVQFINACKQR